MKNNKNEFATFPVRFNKNDGKSKKSKKAEKPKFFSVRKAFRDNVLTEAMVSLGNSFELPVLVKRLG